MIKNTLFLIIILSMSLFAQDIILDRDANKATGFTIVEDSLNDRFEPSFTVDVHIEKIEVTTQKTDKGTFTHLNIPGFQTRGAVGEPEIPVMHRVVEVPFGANLEVRVVSKEEQEFEFSAVGIENAVYPGQPEYSKSEERPAFTINEEAYTRGYQRSEVAQVKEIGVLRNHRLASLEVAPVSYNAAEGKIKVLNNIRLEVSLRGADMAKTKDMYQKYNSPYYTWLNDRFLAPESLKEARKDLTRYPVTYVIVSDRMFEQDLVPFIEWKTAKGFNVEVAYTDTIGSTKEEIQGYLHGLYNNASEEKPAPSFVLFVGDVAQIPAFRSTTSGSYITDLHYCEVNGDYLPDMYYGRFSAQDSSQLVPQINKTIEYERYQMDDPTFLKSVVLIAGWDWSHAEEWGYPQINYSRKYYFNKAKGFDDVSVFLSEGSHQNESQIRAAIGAGAVFVNYTAHGSNTDFSDPKFTISNINSMMNKGRYPLIIGNCCLTNSFQVGTCFGEAWLRADERGAIGYIGGSSYTYWDEDLWWGNGFYKIAHPNEGGAPPEKEDPSVGPGAYDLGIEGDFVSQAAYMVAGNLAVEDSTTHRKKYYWEVYHLMGDPSLMTYWGMPGDLTVEHPATLAKTSNRLTLKTAPNTYVGVSLNGRLAGSALSDKDGNVSIKLNLGQTEGFSLRVVATKKDHKPYEGKIELK